MLLQSKEEIEIWLNGMNIVDYTINNDLTVDVDGDVWLDNKNLIEIPLQFNIVTGVFYCSINYLTSLKGCPNECWSFLCKENQISNLKYAPKIVKRAFICSHNKLISLEGCPSNFEGDLFIDHNPDLKSLKYLPLKSNSINGDVWIYRTKEYKSYVLTRALRK